jgi:signal transduction histidine kinase
VSLKAILTATVVALASLALGAATALVVLTSALHRVTDSMGEALVGVRLAEELEVEVLIHQWRTDPRQALDPRAASLVSVAEGRMREHLEEIRRRVSAPEEALLVQDVERHLHAYLLSRQETEAGGPARSLPSDVEASGTVEQALASLERLVEFNLAEARRAEAQSAYWDRLANVIGFAVAAVLVVGVGAVLLWLRRFAFRPALALGHAMQRFGAGRKRTRAPEEGPTEVREMARTFNEMANSLARQQENQLTFLAGVAHELRNPLSALKLSTALAAPGRGELTPERMQRTLGLVRRQVARLDRMVGDLLDATRIEAGKLELQLEERDARVLAREVVELYQASDPSHPLHLAVPEEPVPLRADAARVEQVLSNLVSNALKYSPAGTRVDVAVWHEGEDVLFSVTDLGIGISAEERRHLFAPFRRSDSARERAPGVGLGLSVSRRIVEAHGGRIEVDSQPGRGSTFRIRLPRALLPATAPQVATGAAPESLH